MSFGVGIKDDRTLDAIVISIQDRLERAEVK
jgi:hypothetical protein